MKVAIIINTSWNIYNFRKGIINYYIHRGHEVVTIAPIDEYTPKLKELGCHHLHLPMEGSGMNPVEDLKLTYRLIKVLKKVKPDIVLSYTIKPNIYGSIACGLLKIPCISNVSGLGTVFLWKGWVKKMASALYSLAFRYNSWVFFQNQDDQAQFLKSIPISKAKTSLVPGSGVNTSYFAFKENVPSKEPVFLMIARLLIDKGVYEFVEAADMYLSSGLKAKFWLIGEKDPAHKRSIDLEKLEQWVSSDTITYFEKVEDVREIISNAEVVVLPSYREGTPRTLLEGAALGRPLIATDVPGCREVVDHQKNGFLCEVKNSASLFVAMTQYAALSLEEKKSFSLQARRKIEEQFDEEVVVELYAQKIAELVNIK